MPGFLLPGSQLYRRPPFPSMVGGGDHRHTPPCPAFGMSQGSNSGPYAYTALYPGLPHPPTPNYTKCLPFSLFSQAVPFHFSYKTICDSVHSCLLGVSEPNFLGGDTVVEGLRSYLRTKRTYLLVTFYPTYLVYPVLAEYSFATVNPPNMETFYRRGSSCKHFILGSPPHRYIPQEVH